VARDHAEQRVSLKEYSLNNVLMEYHFLRSIIFKVLREEAPLTAEESDIINDVIDRGVAHAGQHYMEMSEKKLRESQEHFRLLVEGTAEYVIFMLSPEGEIQTWNPGAERFSGYRAEEVVGKHFSILHIDDEIGVGQPARELRIAIEQGKYAEDRVQVRKDGSSFWASVVITTLYDDRRQIRGFSMVTCDISERKRVENISKEAIRLRDEFLSIASHELKTPLTSLKMQAQMRALNLSRGNFAAFSPERLKKMVSDDTRQIDRISRLIDDMLDISRIHTGKLSANPENFDLYQMTQEVLERYREQIEATGSELGLVHSESAKGYWDRFRLEQVLANLLMNARKYGAGKPIEVSVSREGKWAKLIVRDHGIGIDKANQERIFGRFERAVSPTEISVFGLGLYISKQIVEMHKRSIRVESELGKGSTFTLELPIEAEQGVSHGG
jgi:PAS domain S-box-containing protein